jgi:hypothetical protein
MRLCAQRRSCGSLVGSFIVVAIYTSSSVTAGGFPTMQRASMCILRDNTVLGDDGMVVGGRKNPWEWLSGRYRLC